MLIVTTEAINGKDLEMLGLVTGSTVQTVNALKDIGAGLKNIIGGEVTKYNEMMSKARDLAIERMTKQAEGMGADAIVCVRFSSAEVMQGAAEVMVSGTAVKFK